MFGTYQGEHTRIPLLLLSLGASFGGWIFFFFMIVMGISTWVHYLEENKIIFYK